MSNENEDMVINLATDIESFFVEVQSGDGRKFQLDIPADAFEVSPGEVAKRSMVASWIARAGFMHSLAKESLAIREAELEQAQAAKVAELSEKGAKNEWSCKAEYKRSEDFMEKSRSIADAQRTLALLEKLISALSKKAEELKARIYQSGQEYRLSGDIARDSGQIAEDLGGRSAFVGSSSKDVDGPSVEEYNQSSAR